MDSFYTLKEDQYAVLTTFGKPATVSASGLQMKIPLVQRVQLVSKSIQGFPARLPRGERRVGGRGVADDHV